MAQYTCLGCGYRYDEAQGLPAGKVPPNYNALLNQGCAWHKSEGQSSAYIPPGTAFDTLPDDFTCPSCGAGKADFEG